MDVAGREEAEKDIIDRVQKEIEQVGGFVETVQKMGAKPFARASSQRAAGHYVNVIFKAPPTAIAALDAKFHLDTDLFRWQFTELKDEKARPPKKAKKTAATATA